MPRVTELKVLLHGEVIGTLTLLPTQQTLFTFNASYMNNPDRNVLSLSFKDVFGNLITDIKPTLVRVPTFFSNLLPEGHLRDYLAAQAGVHEDREFFLLWVLGRDLPGALTVEPTDGESWPPSSENSQQRASHENALRFSLAGIQLKFSAVMGRSGGLAIPAEGVGGSWIIKLPSLRFIDVPENEFSMMSLARKMGMDIPDVQLISLNDVANLPENIANLKGAALAIRRFDRTDNGKKIHIEDFAQVLNISPKDKYRKGNYKNIAEILRNETDENDVAEFIRRLVFNTLIGNADMHLKNWSLIYPDGKNAALAPGYDFVSTIAYLPDEDMALNYVKTKRRDSFSLEALSYFANKAKIPEALVLNTAKETIEKFKIVWTNEKQHLPLTATVIHAIEQNVKKIPLFKELSFKNMHDNF